jgi:Methyltransferase domain
MIGTLGTTDIGCVVTDDYLLDFLILYESLAETWTSSPFTLHAFTLEDDVARHLAGIDRVVVHRLPRDASDWRQNAAVRIELIEHSGLERCIVTDADNLVLAEFPEFGLLLCKHELVFAGGPSEERPIQPGLWAYRQTRRTVEFARSWHAQWAEPAPPDAGRLLYELLQDHDLGDAARVVAPGATPPDASRTPSPYALDADLPELSIARDWLGFREVRAGRLKVLHLRGLRGAGRRSLAERIEVLVDRFPGMAPLLPLYLTFAERAADRIGVETVPNPMALARDRLLDAGIPATRGHLPELLNRRGLDGTGAEIGVKRGIFSEQILSVWRGDRLISVDPWLEAPGEEYVDTSNVSQDRHDQFYEEAARRLERFGDRSEIWRMTSVEAAARIAQNSLDFVYLDARHDYASVEEDLAHWFPKVRPGGIVAGHDYLDGQLAAGSFGVKSAVDEFFGRLGLAVSQTYGEPGPPMGPPPSWVVEIPARRES